MAMADGSLWFDTKIDTSGVDKGLKGLKSSISTFAKVTSAALLAVGTMATKVGMDFTKGMSRVGALSGATGKELQALTDNAKLLGKTTVFSATQASEAMSYLAMSGFKTNEIIETMPGLLSLAAAGQTDLGLTADITSNILSGFNLKAEESGRVADVLALAFTSSNTSLESLGESMKFVAPVASSLGFSIEEVSAALGIMGDYGIQGSMAGTSLRTVMQRLVAPTKQVQAGMDKLGLSVVDSNGNMKSLTQIIAEMEKGLEGMTEAEKAATLAQIAGREASSGLTAIISEGSGELAKFTQELENAGGTADKIAGEQLDNLSGDLELLKSVLEGLGIAIFEGMDNPLRQLIQSLTKYSEILLSTIETMKQYVGSLDDAEGRSERLSEATKRITTVLMNMLGKAIKSIFEQIPEFLNVGTEIITNILNGLTAKSGEMVTSSIEIITTIADTIIQNIPIIAEAGLNLIKGLAMGIIDNLPTLIEEVPRIINDFASAIYDLLPVVIKTGVEIIVALAKGLVKAIPTLIANLPAIIMAIVNAFTLHNWAQIGKNILSGIGSGIKGMASNLLSVVKNIGNNVMETIRYILNGGGIKLVGRNLMIGLKEGVKGMLSTILAFMKSLGTSIIETIKAVFTGNIGQVGRDLVNGLWNGISNMTGWILDKIKGFGESIMGGIKGVFGIKSPSTKMRDEVGAMLVQGIGVGIKKEVPALRRLNDQEMDKLISDYGKHGEDAVKQYAKLSKKEMGKLKKQYKKDGEGLAEAIAEGQKAKLNEITKVLDQAREETTKQLDKLGEATITALRRQYEEEERELVKSIEKKISLAEKESDERIKIYEKELMEKLRLLDTETNEELRALQDRIDGINAQTEAEEKAIKEQEFQDKLAKKEEELRLAKTKSEKEAIQKDINEMLAQKQREQVLEQRKEQINALKEEMNKVKEQASNKKQALEEEYKAKMDNERSMLENTIAHYNRELEATRDHYSILLKEENLQAEARKLILAENNEDLINLLESYNPDWHDAGQSFGQSLLDGLNSMKYEIKDVVDEIMSMVSTAETANARIIQAKLDYEAAKVMGDQAGMDSAHKRAERYRQAGGSLGADQALNLDKYRNQLEEKIASEQARANRYQETTNALRSNPYANGVTQKITIVSPENTPAENARQMKLRGEELARGY